MSQQEQPPYFCEYRMSTMDGDTAYFAIRDQCLDIMFRKTGGFFLVKMDKVMVKDRVCHTILFDFDGELGCVKIRKNGLTQKYFEIYEKLYIYELKGGDIYYDEKSAMEMVESINLFIKGKRWYCNKKLLL